MEATHWLRATAFALIAFVLAGGVGRVSNVKAQTGTASTANVYGVECSGAGACFAVGAGGLILRYESSTSPYWAMFESPTTNDLYDVACIGAFYPCFAVGANGTILRTDGTLQPNGLSWVSVPSGTTINLYGVTCASTNLCFAVGAMGTLVQYDGHGWVPRPPFLPASTGVNSDLYDVACLSATLCFAVGSNGTVLQFNGSAWSSQASGTTYDLISVACLTATYCLAAGSSGTVEQYNGNGWSSLASNTTSSLSDVACPVLDRCLVVGVNSTLLENNGQGWIIERASGLQPYAFSAGWNLIGAPTGTTITGNRLTILTYQANDNSYETIPPGTPLQSGVGYWVYSTGQTSGFWPDAPCGTFTVSLPANHWIMIGNPCPLPVVLSGADVSYGYAPSQGYLRTVSIGGGSGAWVYSANGGTLTISVELPPATPPPF